MNWQLCRLPKIPAGCDELHLITGGRLMRAGAVGVASGSVGSVAAMSRWHDRSAVSPRLSAICAAVQVFSRAPCPASRTQPPLESPPKQPLLCSPSRCPCSGPCVAWPSGACAAAPRRWAAGWCKQHGLGAGRSPLRLPPRHTPHGDVRKPMRPLSGGSALGCSCRRGPPRLPPACETFVGPQLLAAHAAHFSPRCLLATLIMHTAGLAAARLPEWQSAGTGIGCSFKRGNLSALPQLSPPVAQMAEAETAQPKAAPTSGRQAEIYIGHSKDQVRAVLLLLNSRLKP